VIGEASFEWLFDTYDTSPVLDLKQIAPPGLLATLLIATAGNTTPVTPNQVVTAIVRTLGVTPGERRNHTKGICASGDFATSEAADHSRSKLFSGESVPVVARFFIAGGNPKVLDTGHRTQTPRHGPAGPGEACPT
jgi:hypothetical protein